MGRRTCDTVVTSLYILLQFPQLWKESKSGIRDPSTSERECDDQFREGLRNNVKDLLLTFHDDPKSLTEAISRVVRCDNRLFERRSEMPTNVTHPTNRNIYLCSRKSTTSIKAKFDGRPYSNRNRDNTTSRTIIRWWKATTSSESSMPILWWSRTYSTTS